MFRIIDSNVFEAIGAREIGLTTSFSIVFGGFTFGTGITFADFHVSGIIPSHNELLNITVKGPAGDIIRYSGFVCLNFSSGL